MKIKKKTVVRNNRFTKEALEFLKKNGGKEVAKYLRSGL